MKKTYEKPIVAVELYVLSQAISACEDIKIGMSSSECVANDPDATQWMKIFAKQNWFLDESSCTSSAVGMDTEDGVCYHTSMGRSAFTS